MDGPDSALLFGCYRLLPQPGQKLAVGLNLTPHCSQNAGDAVGGGSGGGVGVTGSGTGGGPGSFPVSPQIISLDKMEARYLNWAAENSNEEHSVLARRLGVSERTLYRKLRRLRKLNRSRPAVQT